MDQSNEDQPRNMPPDVMAAIGNPPSPRSWPTEQESGWQMKLEARRKIDSGELKSPDEAKARFRARAAEIVNLKGVIDIKTAEVWYRMERQFLQSAIKYFNELKEIKESFKR